MQVITPYIERGLITLVDWPDYPGQYSAYFNWYQTYRQETRWAAFIDADEFLCPIKEKTLTDALKQYCNYPAVLVYWKHFGTSGLLRHDSNKLVIEQYIACYPELMSEGKVFYNTRFDAATRFISMHELKTRWKGFVIPPVNTFYKFVIWNLHQIGKNSNAVIQLNHYWSKAYECWEKKYEKGSIEKGVRLKNDCISPIADVILYRCALRCLSINELFGFVQFFFEIRILNGVVFYQIHIPFKQFFQRKLGRFFRNLVEKVLLSLYP